MADAIVSVIFDRLASVGQQQLEQEVRLVVGVKREVHKLTSNLQAIQAVLEDAERRELGEAAVREWLDKLKDVLYDIDDVLDDWNTALLKMQIEGDKNSPGQMRKIREDENAPKLKRKLCSFIFLTCFPCTQVALRHDIAVKIKQLNERLDFVVREKRHFNFVSTRGAEEIEQQMTASVIDVSEVHGRDQDKSIIVNMLLSKSSQGPSLRIISIVGMGGIGKTTLAQLVYNDVAVKAHFEKRIWVCVSDPFDEIRIAKAILEALSDYAPNFNELESLLRHIHHSIEGKKILLVLDDMWTEDYRSFEQLTNSLNCGSPGSRILVTTRKETVAKIIGTTDMFRLGQLSNEECWSLFSYVAFFGRSDEEREHLKDIGQKIANKCKGLPLAAKVLGSLLCFKKTIEEWESVLDSEVWKLEEAETGLFPSLLLSYYDLSTIMRRCFSYCAIFPKDYKIEKDRLIKLWMTQDYLRAIGSRDIEIVGEECFRNLAMRSFFQDIEEDKNGGITTCKMHDIVHDFAQFLTQNECFVMEVLSPEELRLDSSLVKACHLTMMLTKTVPIPAFIYNVKKLRSLIVESEELPMINAALPKLFNQLTCLRTLNLSWPRFGWSSLNELPREVGKLIHLRYLNLADNDKLEKLPEEVSDLCNLQSLNLNRCTSLKELPRGLGNLINLRHLELLGTISLGFMPRGINRLSSLRTLHRFVVSSDGNVNEASTLEDLKNLNHLGRYLEIIELRKVIDVSEVKKAQLYNKKHLLRLVLYFGSEEGEGKMTNDEQLLEALQPPPNLELLTIANYRGTVFPEWMMPCLRYLSIWDCPKLKALPDHLLQTTSLEKLQIWGCPILEERYKARTREDWHKISHIPNIEMI